MRTLLVIIISIIFIPSIYSTTQTTNGITLNYDEYIDANPKDNTIYDLAKNVQKNLKVVSSNPTTKSITYTLFDFTVPEITGSNYYLGYNTNFKISRSSGSFNSLKCNSKDNNPNCIFTYTTSDTYENGLKQKLYICNDWGGCWIGGKKFTLSGINDAEQIISGINIKTTRFIDSSPKDNTIYDLSKDVSKNLKIISSDIDTKQITYSLYDFINSNITGSSYYLGHTVSFKIDSSSGSFNTKKCNSQDNDPNCIFTYISSDTYENALRQRIYFCNDWGGCWIGGKKFTLEQIGDSEQIISGINIKLKPTTDSNPKNYTMYDLGKNIQKSLNIISSNITTKEIIYSLNDFTISTINSSSYELNYTTSFKISSSSGSYNTKKCDSKDNDPNCIFTYITSDTYENALKQKLYICNDWGGCWIGGEKFTLSQIGDVEQNVNGINLKFGFFSDYTPKNNTIYDLAKNIFKTPITTSSNITTKQIRYTIDDFNVNTITDSSYYLDYTTSFKIALSSGAYNTLRCNSEDNNPNCIFTYTTSDMYENGLKQKLYICNDWGGCWIGGEKFTISQLEDGEQIVSGINLETQSFIIDDTSTRYISPTPANNLKTTNQQFTIKVQDGSFSANFINVTINGVDFSMNETSLSFWEYSFNTTDITIPTKYEFQVYTVNTTLDKRTITVYPYLELERSFFPSISISGIIIAILTIILFI